MAYAVKLAERAKQDLRRIYRQIGAGESAAAERWYWGLRDAVLSLEEFPERCAQAPEGDGLRQLVYGHGRGRYRVLFELRDTTVLVMHIRHGAREWPEGAG